MVESNSRAGMNGEHSPCDALIPSIIVDWVVAEPLDLAKFDAGEVVWSEEDKKLGVERLEWVVDETIRTELKGASERANTLIADSDASQLWFDEYGADWMKANGI